MGLNVVAHERTGFERILELRDDDAGLRGLLVIHSTVRGPAFGGIRRRIFDAADPSGKLAWSRARDEVLDLAEAMSLKCALASLDAGGGKCVMLDHPGLDRAAAYRAFGRVIESLDGNYVCGPDVGSGDAELAYMRAETEYVNPVENDASARTAEGVLAGLRATVSACFGAPTFAERSFAVEGLGAVGSAVARSLQAVGARVSGYDPDPEAARRAASMGVRVHRSIETLDAEACEILVPCALGASLRTIRLERASYRGICGSANNQLDTPDVDAGLRDKGIFWAPDFAVSAGAVIEGVLAVESLWANSAPSRELIEQRVAARIADIERTCEQIFVRSARTGRGTGAVAESMARRAMRSTQPPTG